MNIWTILATAFIVGFSGAIMPGPMFTLVIREVPYRGPFAGTLVTLGHAFLEILIVTALIFGLGIWIQKDLIIGLIGLIGGLTLLWMGIDMVRTSWTSVNGIDISVNTAKPTPKEEASQVKSTPRGLIRVAWGGFVTSCTNPYWVLWWATIGANYVTVALKSGTAGISAFYIGHISSDFVWFTFVSVAAATGSKFLSPRLYQGVVIVCGLFLMGLAGYFFISGVRLLA